jgi:hypothetical protein
MHLGMHGLGPYTPVFDPAIRAERRSIVENSVHTAGLLIEAFYIAIETNSRFEDQINETFRDGVSDASEWEEPLIEEHVGNVDGSTPFVVGLGVSLFIHS